jgi:hypothetical protein
MIVLILGDFMRQITKMIWPSIMTLVMLVCLCPSFFTHCDEYWENKAITNQSPRIVQHYGQEALELWLQALETGDFYQYRKKTGYWKPSSTDPNIHPQWMVHSGQIIESDVCIYMGPYATKDMFLAECNKRGYKYPEDYNRMSDDWIWGRNPDADPKNWPQITEKQYLASLKQQPAAPTNTAAADSLKNFTGNNAEFNAYYYYTNYPDLQNAIGADGAKLLQHYNQYGKTEKRVASKLLK